MTRDEAVAALVTERFGPPPPPAPRGRQPGHGNTHCGRWLTVPREERYDWAGRLVCNLERDHEGAHHSGYYDWWWTDEERTPRKRQPPVAPPTATSTPVRDGGA